MSHAVLAAYGNPLRACDSAQFDGTNDHLMRGANLTGIANSKSGIVSVWVRLDGKDSVSSTLLAGSAEATFFFRRNGTNKFALNCASCNLVTSNSYIAGVTWYNVLMGWDGAAGVAHCYVNDAADEGTATAPNVITDYASLTNWGVGDSPSVARKLQGCLAEFYFAPGQYLDFSLVANRRKFISSSGKPIHLGADGAMPTGTAPLVYFHLDPAESAANFATNRGTGGDFTVTGTLTTGSTSPSA